MPLRPLLPRLAVVALPTASLLLAGVVVAMPSHATAPYTATGSVSLPSSGATGVTRIDFVANCPELPATQGQDGYVFKLPTPATEGELLHVTSPADGHLLQASVFDADCGIVDNYTSDDDGDVRVTLAAGSTFVYVEELVTAPESFTLTISPAAAPSPSASPTPTNDPGTGGLRGRHTYSATPNDPYFPEDGPISVQGQWGMTNIHAPQAWQQPRATGAGVQVAVLDSGLDLGHPDLACDGKIRIAPGATPSGEAPQDVDGHGTHVAGIIGACTDNNTGVVGVAPDATLLPFRVLGPDGGTAEDLAKAIRAAADAGAHVINMSIGFGVSPGGLVTVPGSGSAVALVGGFPEIDDALSYATSRGVVVVAASGNESFPLCGYPALAEKVVCVGSVDRRDLPAYYGNPPVKADGGTPTEGPALVAPGGSGQVFCDVNSEKVLSTYARDLDGCDEGLDPGYNGLDGTSMASPHVAGVAALVYDRLGAVRSAENAAKVVQAMEDGAVDLGTPGYDPVFGYGRIDALGAVQAVTPVVDPTTAPAAATQLALTAPASAQRTDGVDVRAVLTDASGAPVGGQPVQLAIAGGPSAQAVTDAAGVATTSFTVVQEPGQYDVSATFAGTPTLKASTAQQPLAVLAEDTATTLVIGGKKDKPVLTASVADGDSTTSRVAGVLVAFFVDGAQVGTATTDGNGVASFAVTKRAKTAYEARFAGDNRWRASAASARA